MRHALVIMARAPHLGRVKTRLAATLGDAAALAVHRTLTERTLATSLASGMPVTVSVTPASSVAEMQEWLGPTPAYVAQPDGDLGARMADVIGQRVERGSDRVVVIGTDCPGISAATLHSAVSALDASDVVFGPAADGGYYLVAMRVLHRGLFEDIPWSSDRTLAASLRRAEGLGLRVTLLDVMHDVDTEDDWRALVATGVMTAHP